MTHALALRQACERSSRAKILIGRIFKKKPLYPLDTAFLTFTVDDHNGLVSAPNRGGAEQRDKYDERPTRL